MSTFEELKENEHYKKFLNDLESEEEKKKIEQSLKEFLTAFDKDFLESLSKELQQK